MSKKESKYKMETDWTLERKSTFSQEDHDFMVEFSKYFNKELISGNYSDIVYTTGEENATGWIGALTGLTEKNFNDIKERWKIIKKNQEENHEIIREVIKFFQK